MKTLILGLGNLLLGDEGVGVHAARALMKAGCPDGIIVLDIGTAILDALPAIEQADRIIVIDAVKGGGEPGAVYCMPMDAFSRSECIASMHGFDITRVLALAGTHAHPEVQVIGIEPGRMDWSLDLSPEVTETLPTVLDCVYRLMNRLDSDLPEHLSNKATASSPKG